MADGPRQDWRHSVRTWNCCNLIGYENVWKADAASKNALTFDIWCFSQVTIVHRHPQSWKELFLPGSLDRLGHRHILLSGFLDAYQ